jgi:hypothetical protein
MQQWRELCFLGLCLLILGLGLREYTAGFFLTRFEITNKAQVHEGQPPAQYEKVIVLLVDALRADFVFETQKQTAYANKLETIAELRRQKPQNTRLFEFMSDPPTVTMQRVKGLVTGSLPTFIDFKDNLQSDKIQEDNLLYQLREAGKKTLFVGDMIWLYLLPGEFTEAFPYDAHNVRDLDTVDQGVIHHFRNEHSKPWDLIIGHMLGVDHAAHRYHADHPEMTRKLLEVNAFIKEVADGLDDRSLLLVFGDHGMTEMGNHGGSTDEERTSALFAYSKRPFVGDSKRKRVQQIDIVPTISLLLGVGVPFNSLGALIPELFQNASAIQPGLIINAQQVNRYLRTYDSEVKKLPDREYEQIQSLYLDLEKKYAEGKTDTDELIQYIYTAGKMCRGIWTTFDYYKMLTGGFAVIISTISVVFAAAFQIDYQGVGKTTVLAGIISLVSPVFAAGYWLWITSKNVLSFSVRLEFKVIFVIFAMHGYTLFSDSYIPKEDQVVRFLMQLILGFRYLTGYSSDLLISSICVRLTAALDVATITAEMQKGNLMYSPVICCYLPMAGLAYFSKRLCKINLILVLLYWTVPELNSQTIPKIVYAFFIISMIIKRSRWNILPVLLILTGANSPILFVLAILQVSTAKKVLNQPELLGGFIALSGQQYFYATGHRCNIQSLIISSAFIGFDEYNFWISGTLLSLNTLAGFFVCLFCVKCENMRQVTKWVMTYYAVSAVCTMMNTMVNARHLMVWSIFAPKYIFDTIVFFVIWVSCLLMMAIKSKLKKTE